MPLVRPLDRVDVPWGRLNARRLRLLFVARVTMCVVDVKATVNA